MTTILFVHDGQENPRSRQQLLEMSGYTVRLLKSGEECLALIADTRPDLLLLDVLLEGPNGFEICRRIRAGYSAAQIPIVLCSGIYTARVFQDEAGEAGAQAYLIRPYEPADLIEEVRLQLRLAAAARAAGGDPGPLAASPVAPKPKAIEKPAGQRLGLGASGLRLSGD